jgi:hypothetical protein
MKKLTFRRREFPRGWYQLMDALRIFLNSFRSVKSKASSFGQHFYQQKECQKEFKANDIKTPRASLADCQVFCIRNVLRVRSVVGSVGQN